MAIAANEIQLTVTQRLPIGSGRAIYVGTATGGTGYATGGATLGEEPTNSRAKLPEKLDWLKIEALGAQAVFVAPGTVKLFGASTSEGTVAVEFKNAATMATAIAAVPFVAIGAT